MTLDLDRIDQDLKAAGFPTYRQANALRVIDVGVMVYADGRVEASFDSEDGWLALDFIRQHFPTFEHLHSERVPTNDPPAGERGITDTGIPYTERGDGTRNYAGYGGAFD